MIPAKDWRNAARGRQRNHNKVKDQSKKSDLKNKSGIRSFLYIEDEVPELAEFSPLERISKEFRDHFVSQSMLEVQLPWLDAISDKEVPNVDMAFLLATGGATISINTHGGLILMKQDVFLDRVSLCLKEVHGPDALRSRVVRTH